MAIIYTYPVKLKPVKEDLIVLTDSQGGQGDKTRSATLESLSKAVGIDTFVFNQSIPSATWDIFHNLDRFPSVTVIDSSETVVIGTVKYTNADNIEITFSAAFSGTAYLN